MDGLLPRKLAQALGEDPNGGHYRPPVSKSPELRVTVTPDRGRNDLTPHMRCRSHSRIYLLKRPPLGFTDTIHRWQAVQSSQSATAGRPDPSRSRSCQGNCTRNT